MATGWWCELAAVIAAHRPRPRAADRPWPPGVDLRPVPVAGHLLWQVREGGFTRALPLSVAADHFCEN